MDWHYLKDSRQFGPVPEASIRAWCESGFLRPDDLVWHSGLAEWTPVAHALSALGSSAGPFPGSIPGGAGSVPFGSILPPPPGARAYAGFWLRAAAYVIDSLLLSFVLLLIWLPRLSKDTDPMKLAGDVTFLIASFGLSLVYYSFLESSPWQATLGKRIFHLRVTDLEGRRISLPRAALRQVGKFVSGILFYVGYVMAGITPRRQALHDMLAGCLVVRD